MGKSECVFVTLLLVDLYCTLSIEKLKFVYEKSKVSSKPFFKKLSLLKLKIFN